MAPPNGHKRPLSYATETSISRGRDGKGKPEAIEPAWGQIQSAEQSPKAPRLQVERKIKKSFRGRVDGRQGEGRREAEVDQGQFGSPLAHIPTDKTRGN